MLPWFGFIVILNDYSRYVQIFSDLISYPANTAGYNPQKQKLFRVLNFFRAYWNIF